VTVLCSYITVLSSVKDFCILNVTKWPPKRKLDVLLIRTIVKTYTTSAYYEPVHHS